MADNIKKLLVKTGCKPRIPVKVVKPTIKARGKSKAP
jgi:hypothetical protein